MKNYFSSQCGWSSEENSRDYNLRYNLTNKLHGQPLVAARIFPALIGHIKSSSPRKPLVLSFHGPTGTGKNFAARLIANGLIRNENQFEVISCLTLCPCHDACNLETATACRRKLQDRIKNKLKSCSKTIFVFDELENLPAGIIDGITPFLDYSVDSKEYDHRQSIFIFLSNVGAGSIFEIVYDAYKKGEHRKDIEYHILHNALNEAAFNEDSGFMKSKLILKDYIDHMVPFFPLEKEHVEKCISDYTQECYGKKASDGLIRNVSFTLT